MTKGWNVDELTPGTAFAGGLFQVRGVTPRPEGTSLPRVTLILADSTGTCKAKLWEIDDALLAGLVSGTVTYVRASGSVETGGKYAGEVKVSDLQPAPVPEDLIPFLPKLRPHHGDDKKRFFALVRSIGFPFLSELLRILFKPHAAVFYGAYAAESRHHAYRIGADCCGTRWKSPRCAGTPAASSRNCATTW